MYILDDLALVLFAQNDCLFSTDKIIHLHSNRLLKVPYAYTTT